jgi:hypothetical protein
MLSCSKLLSIRSINLKATHLWSVPSSIEVTPIITSVLCGPLHN